MAEVPGSFGSYIDKNILEQIKVRQDIQDRGNQEYYKSFEVPYQNAPWICLRSNVDAPPLQDSKANPESSTSKRYVLCGGTLEYTEAGFSFSGYKGSSDVRNREIPGYVRDSVLGYRPKPGITKMVVKTKDTYGCILEASIDFTVFSIDDLELIDQIYFKPGMSAILEWGHTTWVNNKGNLEIMTPGKLFSVDSWLGSKTFVDLETEIQNHRLEMQQETKTTKPVPKKIQSFCGNYEAMLGYVTNFSYDFNANGSYTCNLKIMSKGTLLEGLKVPSNAGCSIVEQVSGSSSKNNKGSDKKIKSPFHYILEAALEEVDKVDNGTKKMVRCKDIKRVWPDKTVTYTRVWGKKIISRKFFGRDDRRPIGFITLGDFLEITNAVLRNCRDLPNIKFQIPWIPAKSSDKKTISNINYTKQPYASFKEHFSLDPGKALVPVPATSKLVDQKEAEQYAKSLLKGIKDEVSIVGIAPGTVTDVFDDSYVTGRSIGAGDNVILDIFVNIEFILNCLDNIVDTEVEKYSMKEFITEVLGGIQKAFGNVNSFDIHIDPVTSEAVIVDRNCISSDESDISNSDQEPSILFSGPKTVVTGLKITSEISAEIANEMAITATTPEDGLGMSEGNANVVFWNEGCKDRHVSKEEKKESTKTEEEQVQAKYENLLKQHPLLWDLRFLTEVKSLYQNFSEKKAEREAATQGFGEYMASRFGNLQLSGETLFKRCINRDSQEVASKGTKTQSSSYFQAGIIPVKVSFTIRGIGRFLIGTTFKSPEGLLPRKYRDWRNLITGVEHNVDSKGWYTTVSSMYYPAKVKVVRPTGGEGLGTREESSPNILKASELIRQRAADILPAGQPVESPKNSAEKFFRAFWKENVSVSGYCAGYVAMMAKSWVDGKLVKTGGWGDAGDVYTRTGKSKFVSCAEAYGGEGTPKWKLENVYRDKSIAEVTSIISRITEPGTIVVYYWKNPKAPNIGDITKYFRESAKKDRNGKPKKTWMHVQMKMPAMSLILGKGGTGKGGTVYKPGDSVTVTSGWTTSTFDNYGRSNVYENSSPLKEFDKWDIWILTPPPINKAWATNEE